MTRINIINPSELTDQHLIAEYREMIMVPSSLKRTLASKVGYREKKVPKNKTQARLQKKLAKREEEKKIKLNTEQKKTEKTDNVIVEKTE